MVSELDRISQTTEFNGAKLINGTLGTLQFQVGANANQTIVAATANLRTNAVRQQPDHCSSGGWAPVPRSDRATALVAPTAVHGGTVAINGALGSATLTVAVNDTAKALPTPSMQDRQHGCHGNGAHRCVFDVFNAVGPIR